MCSFTGYVIFFGVLSALIGVWVYPYVAFICKYAYFLPIVSQFCPNIIYPPVMFSQPPAPISALATQTANLIGELSKVEIGAPARFVGIQTFVMDIQGRVGASDIQEPLKSQLKMHLTEFDLLLDTGIDNLIEMQSVFISAIDNLRICTEQTLDGVSRIKDGDKPIFGIERIGNGWFSFNEVLYCHILLLGTPETQEGLLNILYEDYLTWISAEITQILEQALATQTALTAVKDKINTLEGLFSGGLKVAEDRMDDIQFGTFWARVFGPNQANQAKQFRAIQNFKDFKKYNELFGNAARNIIAEVKQHQADMKQLEKKHRASGPLQETLEMYLLQMQSAVQRLSKSKDDVNRKIEQSKQQERIAAWQRGCFDYFSIPLASRE